MPRRPSSTVRALRETFSAAATRRRMAITLFAALMVSVLAYFGYETYTAWSAEEKTGLLCGALPIDPPHSYIQYSLKEQAVEPYFRGTIFISLGEASTAATQAELTTTAGGKYGNTVTHVEFFPDEQNKTFWMRKESEEVPFVRTSGSARDFPFDSALVELETTFAPPLPIHGVVLRNFNPSFYIPCDRVTVKTEGPTKLGLTFEVRRKPLVQLFAVVILIAAAMFALIIPFTVKRDALPTSVASFFSPCGQLAES